MNEYIFSGTLSLLTVLFSGGISYLVYRRLTKAQAYKEIAEGDEIYMRSSQEAWRQLRDVHRKLEESNRWRAAATPILLHCAASDPRLHSQMMELKLLADSY